MANYTTEKRHAKVGERILITKAQPCFGQTHENGDVLTVTKAGVMCSGDVYVKEQPDFIDYDEYEVIVEESKVIPAGTKIKIVKPYLAFGKYKEGDVLTVVEHNLESSIYREHVRVKELDFSVLRHEFEVIPAEPVKVGDRVKLLNGGGEFPLFGFENGEEYEVVTVGYQHTKGIRNRIVDKAGVHGFATDEQLEVIVAKPTAPVIEEGAENFKVGDLVKVIGREFGHRFEIGTEVTVKSVNDKNYRVEDDRGAGWYVCDCELELVEAKQKEPTMRFNIGDEAVITSKVGGHHFEIGETVRIRNKTSYDYTAEYLDGRDYWFVCDEELEPAPPTPKKSTFQTGDIVLVSKDFFNGGFYGEVIGGPRGDMSGGNYDVDNGSRTITVLGDYLTMIAPKGNRVD